MALRTPPLREAHADRGARFTEFGGWDMPVEFDSIKTEHRAVRESVGKFDVSHMGEIRVTGPDAGRLTGRLTTNDVSRLDHGGAQYSAITDEEGAMLDDTVVYRLPAGADTGTDADADDESYLFVPNAGHDEQMYDRWTTHRDEWGLDAAVENATEEYAMVALQGPDAADLLAGEAAADPDGLGRFEMTEMAVAGVDCLVSRTGYTGEDGFELLVPRDGAERVWSALECQPCGLGARDTLRIEAGFLLSGQDFHPDEEPRTPYEADIGFVVKLDTEFVGRDALERVHEESIEEKLVGFRLVDRGVPRNGYDVTDTDGRVVGTVTSGTMSPTLDYPVGMGYLPVAYDDPGTTIHVVVRGEKKEARVQSLPFYERE